MSDKLYFGFKNVPKGKKRATMKEAVQNSKYSYWGLYKIDPKILKSVIQDKKNISNMDQLMLKVIPLKAKIQNLKNEYEKTNDQEIANQYVKKVNEYNNYVKLFKIFKNKKNVKEEPKKEPPKKVVKEEPKKEPPKKVIKEEPKKEPPKKVIKEEPKKEPPKNTIIDFKEKVDIANKLIQEIQDKYSDVIKNMNDNPTYYEDEKYKHDNFLKNMNRRIGEFLKDISNTSLQDYQIKFISDNFGSQIKNDLSHYVDLLNDIKKVIKKPKRTLTARVNIKRKPKEEKVIKKPKRVLTAHVDVKRKPKPKRILTARVNIKRKPKEEKVIDTTILKNISEPQTDKEFMDLYYQEELYSEIIGNKFYDILEFYNNLVEDLDLDEYLEPSDKDIVSNYSPEYKKIVDTYKQISNIMTNKLYKKFNKVYKSKRDSINVIDDAKQYVKNIDSKIDAKKAIQDLNELIRTILYDAQRDLEDNNDDDDDDDDDEDNDEIQNLENAIDKINITFNGRKKR